ncbi:MAG TPA: efflux RND transporter permease subunit [Spirochaetia bacterium]|nr:efflux RND transporter permease subunit [Spirochaetia bacterium]
MNITELSVRRPTAILMGMLLIFGLGLVGYLNLGADLFPAVDTPIIAIRSTYAGAGAEQIDKDVIKPIEDAVSVVNGIDTMRSTSGVGYGFTIIQFTMSTDLNNAQVDVQKAINGIVDKLPRDAERPVILTFDVNAQPILILGLTGDVTPEELYNQADTVTRAIEALPGVGSVTIDGGQKKELLVTVDREKMDYYSVSAQTLLATLQADNMNVPAGEIKQRSRDLTVRMLGEFSNEQDVSNLRIPTATGSAVPLSEIAQVRLDYPDPVRSVRLNGRTAIGIVVRKQSNANLMDTANRVKRALTTIQGSLLPGTHLSLAADSTLFISSSLDETRLNLLESIITTSLVLFLFLRRWRSSLIVLIAIPFSLVGTFFAMYTFHFTLNIVSLMALGLCIGILVDDSIVILENVDRHILMGEDARTAAVRGRMEIGLAAVAITLCDVVVFAPIAFLSDIVGQFFRQFGVTVVAATLLSLLVSFTITPMMASRMLGSRRGDLRQRGRGASPQRVPSPEPPAPQGGFGRFFEVTVKGGYKTFLTWCLANRWKVIIAVAVLVVASIALVPLKVIQTEFLPTFDQSRLIVDLDLGPGATFPHVDQKTSIVEQHLLSLPEVQTVYAGVGGATAASRAELTVKLKDKSRRRKSQSTMARELREWGRGLPGVDFSVTEPGVLDRTSIEGTKPFIVNVTGPNRDILRDLAARVEQDVRAVKGTADVDNTMRATQSEVNVIIDRLAASDYGLTAYDVASVLRTALAGSDAGVYRHGGDEFDVTVRYREDQIRTPYDLQTLSITNRLGQQIPLTQVAHVVKSDSPQQVLRRNRQNVATITANIQGRALGAVTTDVKQRLAGLTTPLGYRIIFGGDTQYMATSFQSLAWALLASIVLVYMILVVLYESFLTPMIRMLSIPCGVIGAFSALALTGKAINIFAFIGLIMLDGLISKNGTLLIDYTNTLMKRGKPLREALLEAGITRLRPILMTSVTMIVGMMPLALSLGASSEIRSGMAVVLIGGLVTSTIFTPLLLPVVYTLIDDARKAARGREVPPGGKAS